WLVLRSSRHDYELAFADLKRVLLAGRIPVAHAEAAFYEQKHFVLGRVVVPYEVAPQLDQLHVLAIQLTNDPRAPSFCKSRECVFEPNLLHRRDSSVLTTPLVEHPLPVIIPTAAKRARHTPPPQPSLRPKLRCDSILHGLMPICQ